MAESLQLWRYTAGKTAEDWAAALAYLETVESALPDCAKIFDIAIEGPASDDEVKADPKRLVYRPGFRLFQRRDFLGEKDAEVQRLKGLGKIEEADARADALIVADDAAKVGGK